MNRTLLKKAEHAINIRRQEAEMRARDNLLVALKYPEFKDIYIKNIECNGAKTGIKISGLNELPIHDIYFENVNINCHNAINLSLCKDIYFNNVNLYAQDKEYKFEKERMNG